MHLEHAREGGFDAVTPAPLVVAASPDRDHIPVGENRLRVFNRHGSHDFHPWLMRAQTSSALPAAASVVRIRFGHGRMNPSDFHLRVASMPILLPYAAMSLASSRSS